MPRLVAFTGVLAQAGRAGQRADVPQIVRSVWPGEVIIPEAARNRVHNLASLVRSRVGTFFRFRDDGFELETGVVVAELF